MKPLMVFCLFAFAAAGTAFAQQGSTASLADDNAALQQKVRDIGRE